MAITAYQTARLGNLTTVTVTSDLAGLIYYHWYVDGCFFATTTGPSYTFYLAAGDQARVEVLDTNDPAYDPVANAPDGWPARRALWWCRSVDADVDHYRAEQKEGAGDWTTLALVPQKPEAWDFQVLTGRLADLATYQWRVVPVDAAGNDGTPITLDAHLVVRSPDAPAFALTFNTPATTVTFTAA